MRARSSCTCASDSTIEASVRTWWSDSPSGSESRPGGGVAAGSRWVRRPWCGTPPRARCRAGTRRCRAPGSPRSLGAAMPSESRNARSCASESNDPRSARPRRFESSSADLGGGEPLGDRHQVEPAHAARERAQQRRHGDAEPERVLAGLDAAVEPHAAGRASGSRACRASARRARAPRATSRSVSPRWISTTRRSRAETGPAGRNRSAATARPAASSSSSAQRRGRNGRE